MKKYILIALIGESGSGKDTLLRDLTQDKEKVKGKISYTSRPKRDYETEGVDYYYVDPQYFLSNLYDFFEIDNFNNWYYGTKYEDLSEDKINIGIFTPKGLDAILESKNINCLSVYLKVSDKERLLRSLNREENPNVEEIIRRFKTDKIDFNDIEEKVNIVLENEDKEQYEQNLRLLRAWITRLYN